MKPNWKVGAKWRGGVDEVKTMTKTGWKDRYGEWTMRDAQKRLYFCNENGFTFVGGGGGKKPTKQDQINDLTEQLSAKDKTIAELMELCNVHKKNYSDLSSRRCSESEEYSRLLQAERTRAVKAEERAAQQVLTIAWQKSALDLAGMTISKLSQAAH